MSRAVSSGKQQNTPVPLQAQLQMLITQALLSTSPGHSGNDLVQRSHGRHSRQQLRVTCEMCLADWYINLEPHGNLGHKLTQETQAWWDSAGDCETASLAVVLCVRD